MFSARSKENQKAGSERQRRSERMRSLARSFRPTIILHHPHSTDSPRIWSTAWSGARELLRGALVVAGEPVGADLFLMAVHRPDHRQRLGHRFGLGVVRPFKASPSMGEAQSVGYLPGALPRVGRVRLVAVAEQRAAVLAEKGMVAHLLADDFALIVRNRLNRRVRHLDSLNRYLGAEAQPALGDRRVAHLRATLVGHGLGRHIVERRRRLHPEPCQQIELLGRVDVEALLRILPEELALEPVELLLERVVLRLQLFQRRLRLPEHAIRIAQRNAEPRVLLFEFCNLGRRQRQAPTCIEHNRNLPTLEAFRQPSDSAFSDAQS